MATAGYITGLDGQNTPFDHTNNVALFYGPNSTWWAILVASADADFYIWEWDGTIPASPGDTGGFDLAANSGGGNIQVEHRGTGRPTVFYDESTSILHIVIMHGSTEEYDQYQYNAGTNDWTANFVDENVGTSNNRLLSFSVDSNGVPWVAYPFGSSANYIIKTRYRDPADDTWKDGGDIEPSASAIASGALRLSNGFTWDNGGALSIGVIYTWESAGIDYHKFAYRADSTVKTASWIVEIIESNIVADDHASAVAAKFGSDTTSTVLYAIKQGSANPEAFYKSGSRSQAGIWSSTETSPFQTKTRVKLALDETNGDVYAIYGTGTSVSYAKADATTALVWGAEIVIIEDDGVATFSADITVPDRPVTGATDLLVMGVSGSKTWWNTLPLTDPVSGDTMLPMLSNYGQFNGGML